MLDPVLHVNQNGFKIFCNKSRVKIEDFATPVTTQRLHGACALMTASFKMATFRKTRCRDSAMGIFAVLMSLQIFSVSCASLPPAG